MEDWVTIRNLKKKNPELGTRAIAKLVGVSRNTVKKALKADFYPQYERKTKASDEISVFHDFIKDSYLLKKQRVSVIIENLKSKGFKGSKSTVYRYVKENFSSIREDLSRKAFLRYETAPAEQMQYDWAEYEVLIGQSLVKLYVHCLIYGYSRYRVYDVTVDKTQSSIFSVLQDAFSEAGGVCRRLQVDNAVQFVADADIKKFRWNEGFLNFCGFYGIKPTRSLPYHPWSKGKVESPFYYLEEHFIKNNTFESITDFQIKLKEFQNAVNNKIHTTTKSTPFELFKKERQYLIEAKDCDIASRYKQTRKVTQDCLISYKGNRYSVSYHFAGKTVWILPQKGLKLRVYNQQGRVIAEHPISLQKGQIIMDKSHFKSSLYQHYSNFERLSYLFKERFCKYNKTEEFLTALKQQRNIQPRYHLAKIMDLMSYYQDESCISVMEECFKYRNFNLNFIKGLLMNEKQKEPVNLTQKASFKYEGMQQIKRNLKEYKLWQI
ncbi:IS21 family transposase [Thermodesulfovibrio aggregans]|nr:IS21 family transposase [Thermodesulfovibrio aggregans]